MALIPFIAMMAAMISVLLYYAGLEAFAMLPFAVTGILALVGMAVGVPERPVSSRLACLFSLGLAATPLIAPVLKDLRMEQLERARAREIAPLYQELDATVKNLEDQAHQYVNIHGFLPEFQGTKPMPFVNSMGNLVQRPPMGEMAAPQDPFDKEKRLRWVNVANEGALLVSVGQDQVPQLPLPGVWMDGPPVDPLAPFASSGVDPRTVTMNEDSNALALADVVKWIGRGSYEESFARLFRAWDDAESASPFIPVERRDKDAPISQGTKDAQGAERLLASRNYLAALALSSRAFLERHQFPAQWSDAEKRVDLYRGMALYHLASYRHAADAFIMYLDQAPNDSQAHLFLGASLYYGGDKQAASVHLAAAQQINPSDPTVRQIDAIMAQLSNQQQPAFPRSYILDNPPTSSNESSTNRNLLESLE